PTTATSHRSLHDALPISTWKVGATFSPVGDLRLRTTLSRDIRAPNLAELFEAGGAQTNSVSDPFNNNQTVQFLGLISGNPNLQRSEEHTSELQSRENLVC